MTEIYVYEAGALNITLFEGSTPTVPNVDDIIVLELASDPCHRWTVVRREFNLTTDGVRVDVFVQKRGY